MNNILGYIDYLNSINTIQLNEGDGIIRTVINKTVQKKIRHELSEEIEMSKGIIETIQNGLKSLDDNFGDIEDNLAKSDSKSKGKKQKQLDEIKKILDDSRKTTWDINALIDDGEIDYAGFAANVGIATVGLFGVLLSPIRARFIVHKGYNYFFAIVKNTIRKALVMLQINFDMFENLIITQGFQSEDYLKDSDTAEEIGKYYGNIWSQLFDDKHGSMKNKRGHKSMEQALKMANDKFRLQMQANKQAQQSKNVYNCLDNYNNTYTKSLETLKNYTQDDVQKQLDGIKNSMTRLANGDQDLTAYGEMIIASAEEHAYKVSSSIYSKFAKMTEVFSLPNQQKLIDLIQSATEEREKAAADEKKKKMEEEDVKNKIEDAKKKENDGIEIFKKVVGARVGKLDKDNKYTDVFADDWTYDEFKKLDQDDQDTFTEWLLLHEKDVLMKCDETLKVAIPGISNEGYFEYIDILIDYIKPSLIKGVNELQILSFDNYCTVNESLTPKRRKELKAESDKLKRTPTDRVFDDLITYITNDEDLTQEMYDELEFVHSYLVGTKDPDIKKYAHGLKTGYLDNHKSFKKGSSDKNYIDLNDTEKSVIDILTKKFKKNEKIAKIALEVIGDKFDNKSFAKMSDTIVEKIIDAIDSSDKKAEIKGTPYKLLSDMIDTLKEERKSDYPKINGSDEKE